MPLMPGVAPTSSHNDSPGFKAAAVRLRSGDLTTEQMFVLADLAERYANGNIRTTINQNMMVRWIPDNQLLVLL